MEGIIKRLMPSIRDIVKAKTMADVDDVAQEAIIAIMASYRKAANEGKSHSDSYYLKRADWAACDYIDARNTRKRHEREAGMQRARRPMQSDTAASIEAYRNADPWLAAQLDKWPSMTWHYMTLGA